MQKGSRIVFVSCKALATKWTAPGASTVWMSGKNSFFGGREHHWEAWVRVTYPATHLDRALDTTRGNLRASVLKAAQEWPFFAVNTRTRGTAPFSVTARTGWRLITRPGHFCPCVCNCCWPWRPRWLPPPALRRLKGVIYGTDLADSCDRAPRGRPANLGLQPELGVRAQRRLGAGAGGSSGALPLGAPPLLMGCGSCLALADPQRFRVNGPHSLPPPLAGGRAAEVRRDARGAHGSPRRGPPSPHRPNPQRHRHRAATKLDHGAGIRETFSRGGTS
jgi:hypothetical protein